MVAYRDIMDGRMFVRARVIIQLFPFTVIMMASRVRVGDHWYHIHVLVTHIEQM